MKRRLIRICAVNCQDGIYSLIDQLSALCRSRGIDFSVVILYPKDAVRGGLVEWWSESRGPGSLIRRHVEQQGIRVLDLLDEMHGPADAAAYYFRKDGHPNAAGNARIAEAMLDALIR